LNDRQPIQEVVTAALKSADAKRNRADPTLVVIGHSMGGNILYDLLTSRLAGAIEVDAFVTVGSQVGLFKELELYTEDARNAGATSPASTAAPQLVEKPAAVGTWINVFDPLDVLGFAIEGVFKDVHDFAFSNGGSVLETHSLYFFRPAFHERLGVRLASAGIGKKS
jgi:pimeloyl-ACP methyl ester carboxylesterase